MNLLAWLVDGLVGGEKDFVISVDLDGLLKPILT